MSSNGCFSFCFEDCEIADLKLTMDARTRVTKRTGETKAIDAGQPKKR